MKMLHKGLRAFISLMPEAFENNRIVNGMNLDHDDEAVVQFSKAFVLATDSASEIKCGNLAGNIRRRRRDRLSPKAQLLSPEIAGSTFSNKFHPRWTVILRACNIKRSVSETIGRPPLLLL